MNFIYLISRIIKARLDKKKAHEHRIWARYLLDEILKPRK